MLNFSWTCTPTTDAAGETAGRKNFKGENVDVTKVENQHCRVPPKLTSYETLAFHWLQGLAVLSSVDSQLWLRRRFRL
jgi:hypothetical protein